MLRLPATGSESTTGTTAVLVSPAPTGKKVAPVVAPGTAAPSPSVARAKPAVGRAGSVKVCGPAMS